MEKYHEAVSSPLLHCTQPTALAMPSPSPSPSPSPQLRVLSRRTVKPPPRPRPRQRIPLTTWDVSLLPADYIQKGLLYAKPPYPTARLVDHLQDALVQALHTYYPVAGRFATDQHRDADGNVVVGCSVSIDCDGQGVDIVHAVADGVTVDDVVPPDVHVPLLVQSLFPLDGAVNHDGHHLPLFVVQVTDLTDGVFLGFAYNHALSDGTALWKFINVWAAIARGDQHHVAPPLLDRWSPAGVTTPTPPVVLPFPGGLTARIENEKVLSPPPLRERMLQFSAHTLETLKDRARQELLAAGDPAGAAAVTKFQALSSLVWRCVTRARRLPPDQETFCRAAINNRTRLRPQLPPEYFGNTIYTIATEAVTAADLLERGHGWATAAVGRAVAAHTDADIRARVAAWMANPVLYNLRHFSHNGIMVGSSPRFDMYRCDFGWGAPLAARSGKANKSDGKASLYPGQEGGGSIAVELVLTPEHMALLDKDEEFWAAVSPDKALSAAGKYNAN